MTDSAILPPAPPEPPRNSYLSVLAPGFLWRLNRTLADANTKLHDLGYAFRFGVFETIRSDARQQWLFGSGRTYAGRWLTNAQSAQYSWHGFALAADCVPRPLTADGSLGDWTWDVRAGIWTILFDAATNNGCTTGLHWPSPNEDMDHIQPAGVRVSPSHLSRDAYASGGLSAVWEATGMTQGRPA